MKKILFFLSLMMVAFFTANAQLKDDVNDDGVVDMSDATTLIDHVLNGVNNGSSHIFIAHNVMIEMVRVEGGTFTMGATEEQGNDADSDESPTHQVTLSSYMIGKTEVT
ncbi:MAG: SUMF1/EgtB/PvdO family nonheme iron enzyme, partial [Sodaliphilus sp.]|nr:SUMF1/EgtB/PvdO family nonheme iron enzyme [Sodaliphilus sp.]